MTDPKPCPKCHGHGYTEYMPRDSRVMAAEPCDCTFKRADPALGKLMPENCAPSTVEQVRGATHCCPECFCDTGVPVFPPTQLETEQQLVSVKAENTRLKAIAVHLHCMARRYADGRQSYATSLHNENTRELLAMNVPLNATGDGTLWARDSAGRAYDCLTDEEAAQGREPDWRHDDKERRIEEQAEQIRQLRLQVEKVEREIRFCAYTSAGDPSRSDDTKMFAIWSGALQRALAVADEGRAVTQHASAKPQTDS